MRTALALSLVWILTSNFSCTNHSDSKNADDDYASVKKTLEKINADWKAYLKNGDSVGFASVYTADAKLLMAGHPPMNRDDVIRFIGKIYRYGITELVDTSMGLWGNGDFYAQEYANKFYNNKGEFVESGREMLFWKKENGSWKVFRDMYYAEK